MNKVYTLHDAVAKFVEDGDCISFGGFTTNRKPYAVVGEILRQGQKDFTVWAGPAGGDWDMLIGEGRVKAYINCYTANSGYTNVSRRFRAAIEKGELTYEDYSQDVLMLQLHAASLGLPFLPVRLMQGSGLVKYWGISEEQRKALDKVDDLKCVEIENPFEPGQKVIAVPVPKLDTAVIHVQKASPDGTCIIEGDEFHDVDIAVAARKVIVTCEELVSDEYIRRDPTLTKVFGECVNAVVHCPYGAWPSRLPRPEGVRQGLQVSGRRGCQGPAGEGRGQGREGRRRQARGRQAGRRRRQGPQGRRGRQGRRRHPRDLQGLSGQVGLQREGQRRAAG